MKKGDIINFVKNKKFKYIKTLGRGGTGDTHLFVDEITEMQFAIKKYSPKQEEYRDAFYNRFVDEIKILFKLTHPNIVRIYNYYLYPESKNGYLQMEYIDGISIDKYEFKDRDKSINDIFITCIDTFKYLENNNILHRDIRPSNILIDNDNNVKIIDFGFGKILDEDVSSGESVVLNWTENETNFPDEVKFNKKYTNQSEIYFLGRLFDKIIKDNDCDEFKYKDILNKMIKTSPRERYKSFSEIDKNLSQKKFLNLQFTSEEKDTYLTFANSLIRHICDYTSTFSPELDIAKIMNNLSNVLLKSSLEEYIQNNEMLISCFIKNSYKYIDKTDITVSSVSKFYAFLINASEEKRKVIYDNLFVRLSSIKVIDIDDDMPF